MDSKDTQSPKGGFFFRSGLKNRLIGLVIGVGTIPLILAMLWSYIQGNNSLKQVIGSSFQALAYETSTKIDFLFEAELHRIEHWSHHPTLIITVEQKNRRLDTSPEIPKTKTNPDEEYNFILKKGASRVLKSLLHNDPDSSASTQALFLTDLAGNLVSSMNNYPPLKHQDSLSWKTLVQKPSGKFIGETFYDPKLETHVFEVAVPVKNQDNKTIGALHAIYSTKEFFSTSIENILFGETGHVMLINGKGVVLDCPILPTGHQLEDPKLVKNVTGPEAAWAETLGDGHGSMDVSLIGYSPLIETNRAISNSKGPTLYTFAWQSSDELFTPTRKLLGWMSAAGFLSILLIAVLGSLGADSIVRPIRQLQKTAESIGRGEDVAPLKIETGDEIQSLAEEINTMNGLIQKAFSGLEQQVEEKTREVVYLRDYNETILQSVPEAILIFKTDGTIEYANAAFEKLTEKTRNEFTGKLLGEISTPHEEEWKFLAEELQRYIRNQTGRTHKSSNTPYQAKDPLAPSSANNEPQPTILMGELYFAYQFFEMKVEDEGHQRVGLIMKNITEEKKLLDQLTQADKLSGLGTLTAGIAHEMNNPLYSIMGFSEAILDEKDPATIRSFAQKVLDRSRHMSNIILNMSGYVRSNEKDQIREVDINERLDAAIDMAMLASYSSDIHLEKQYNPLPKFHAKPEEIQQVFMNIIRNAVQAMDGKGKIIIHSAQNNGDIQVSIQDNGPGIPAKYLNKVFDPFFTTKGQGEGTGLGLNIVHRVVEKYSGRIEVDSQVGKGTTFHITLPVNANAPVAQGAN